MTKEIEHEPIVEMKLNPGYLDNWGHLFDVQTALNLKKEVRDYIWKNFDWIDRGAEGNSLADNSTFELIPGFLASVDGQSLLISADPDFDWKDTIKNTSAGGGTFPLLHRAVLKGVRDRLLRNGKRELDLELDDPIGGDRTCRRNIETGCWDDTFSMPFRKLNGPQWRYTLKRELACGGVMEIPVQLRLFVSWPEPCDKPKCKIPKSPPMMVPAS
jgi:hypothetical protein